MTGDEELIGSADACRILDIDRSTLTRWVASGKLAAETKLPKANGAFVFRLSAVERLAEMERAPKAATA